MKTFLDILTIARENVKSNPHIIKLDSKESTLRYLDGLEDEVEEVRVEVKENNEVFLVDELSDIAWDYAMVLSVLENRGLIENAEEVLTHGYKKYTQRLPSIDKSTVDVWDKIKVQQKRELKERHSIKYGNA